MSITLPVVNLSNAVVGTSGTVPLQGAGVSTVQGNDSPTIQIYNDSGAGLNIQLKTSGHQFYLSAKAHATIRIDPHEIEVSYVVVNISTNIQVNSLVVVYFYPWDEVVDFSALGTSSVSQQATTVNNVGNPSATPFIFANPVGDNNVTGVVSMTVGGILALGDTLNPGKINLSGSGASNNLFPGSIDILGTNFQEINTFFSGTEAYFKLIAQSGALSVLLGTDKPVINGSTSGTATLWQTLQGDVKVALVVLNNFRNGNAGAQLLSIPVPFTTVTGAIVLGFATFQLKSGGIAQSGNVITSLGATGGTPTASSTFGNYSLIQCGAIDQISFNGSQAGATALGVMLMFGS